MTPECDEEVKRNGIEEVELIEVNCECAMNGGINERFKP